MKRGYKIYATKASLLEQLGEDAATRYKDSMVVHDAMQSVVDALCRCAVANHLYGGVIFSVTEDKMEWSVEYKQLGIRDPKTGKIP